MNKQRPAIDLVRMGIYILKRIWLVAICAIIGFIGVYWWASKTPDRYTASGTMFITNSNPNLVNYGYTSSSDISSAVRLVDIYSEVVKSETVMQRILEYRIETAGDNGAEQDRLLCQKYPFLTSAAVRSSISMKTVNDTPMVRVSCTTTDPLLSTDICNAVLQVAPTAIKDVVGAGDAKPQDYATVPTSPAGRSDRRQGMLGALGGAAFAVALLILLFLFNRWVDDAEELKENYGLPVLASVRRRRGDDKDPGKFLLNDQSDMDQTESYAKLRMNMLYTLVGKEQRTVLITSAVSGEGKSTIAANLAVSLALGGKHVLLVDADMRRACQCEIFHYDTKAPGLSDLLVGNVDIPGAVLPSGREGLDLLPAGGMPPNPSELLESQVMKDLIAKLEAQYDLILLDAPPINIVSDPLALSDLAAGALFVVRQHFSDHREVHKALVAAELTGLEVLGFIFYGERLHQGSYYSRKYYHYHGYHYYHKYDTKARYGRAPEQKLSESDISEKGAEEK